eukprot:12815524-Heterocapsa_arctica.AAC.1
METGRILVPVGGASSMERTCVCASIACPNKATHHRTQHKHIVAQANVDIIIAASAIKTTVRARKRTRTVT